ncbi:MAG: hypothetical protein RhofKO_25140 [Rhodothermales bacterium]
MNALRYEYQIVELELDRRADVHKELVATLNKFGAEGWRLHEFQVNPIRATNERHFRLLLERMVKN